MRILTRLETARALDPVSDKLQDAVFAAPVPDGVRDLLHGTWLGHPLHPVLVQAPVGAFISAAVLDVLPGTRRAATALVAVGTAGAVPAMAAGLADWSQMTRDRRRVGLVHAAANLVAVGLYAGSLVARLRGRHTRGRALGFAGLSVAGLGAYLGGHLAYAQSGGANQAAPEIARIPEEWTVAGSLASLPDRKPAVRTVGDVAVLFYRDGDTVSAMIERCGHETAPLGEGDVIGEGPDACVVCPWHGSTFRLRDGAVRHGPAASDQPILPVRVQNGNVEVRQP
ncbi:Rieske 2Fe-2S domain-containing protein [Actinoplanes sp. NPDC026619]|uniref:Rieske 2Fe-2S domain-containing protein n=1 Tax=Actinoplanes sp. NPDC026619 TaxID=3155798 RepID=UPI0033EF9F7D